MKLHFAALVALVHAGCAVSFGLINQGDRAPGTDLGLPPPPAEAFSECSKVGNRVEHVDTDGDGRVDTVRISTKAGVEVCRGVDANRDGKLDTWDVIKDGRVVERSHDSDGDGKVDQHWHWPVGARPGCGVMQLDRDADGKPDLGSPKYDPCGVLAGVVSAPTPPPLGPRATP